MTVAASLRWSLLVSAVLSYVGAAPAVAELTDQQRMSTLAQAQEAYDRGVSVGRGQPQEAEASFRRAAERFQQLVDDGLENGRLYYNLANAYLQAGETGRAILHYRKAQRLIPGDAKLEHNLEYARSLRRNRIAPSGQRALAAALLGWHQRTSLGARFNVFAVFYLGFWLLLTGQILRPRPLLRWLIGPAAVIWIGCGLSVATDVLFEGRLGEGVVLADDCVVRKGNSEGFEPQFAQPLHQGVEFGIVETRPGWLLIELPDQKTGWIRADQVGLVGEEGTEARRH